MAQRDLDVRKLQEERPTGVLSRGSSVRLLMYVCKVYMEKVKLRGQTSLLSLFKSETTQTAQPLLR